MREAALRVDLDDTDYKPSPALQEVDENAETFVLGTELGTSKSTKAVRVPSEATPDKRDMIFDLTSHNPKVVGSNPTPATNF